MTSPVRNETEYFEGLREECLTHSASEPEVTRALKPGTGTSLHTQEPVTVASFRTWRGWRECVARDRCLTGFILALGNSGWARRAREIWPSGMIFFRPSGACSISALTHGLRPFGRLRASRGPYSFA